MKKALKKRENRGQKNLQLYDCTCNSCGICGSGHGSTDFLNMQESQSNYRKKG